MKKLGISEEEFFEKKLEIAKNLLPQMVAKVTEEFMQDKRKRASLLYNCSAISEDMLNELGFFIEDSPKTLANPAGVKRRTLGPADNNVPPKIASSSAPTPIGETTVTDVGNRTAIRKLSEMLPSR